MQNNRDSSISTPATQGSKPLLQAVCQVLSLIVLLALCGCGRRIESWSNYGLTEEPGLALSPFRTSELATQIDHYYRGSNPGPIGVTTLVDLNDLYNTSSFGRMYAEQLMSELAVRGYDVVELRHADALQVLNQQNGGEFALSRDTGTLRRSRDLGGLIVGTYVASPERVYVNARLLDPSTSMVLSAGSVELDRTRELSRLLRIGGFPSTLERIPVRHLSLTDRPLMAPPTKVDELEMGPPAAVMPPPVKTAK